MPRYKLRTLLILLAVLPPVLGVGWDKYRVWRGGQGLEALFRQAKIRAQFVRPAKSMVFVPAPAVDSP